MSEWLPSVGEPFKAEIAALIVSSYGDQGGELCAAIQLTLQQQYEQVQKYCYSTKDIRENWVPGGPDFTLAHVNMANRLHAKAVRFSQRSCTKATGRIVQIKNDHLLEW